MSAAGPPPSAGVAHLDMRAIVAKMPRRHPTVLVDRLIDVRPGQWIRGLKNVALEEPYFRGHFPGYPVMPGVLILEALTQLSGALAVASGLVDADGAPAVVFEGIDGCRFRRQVVPGDQLTLESHWRPGEHGHGRFDVRALVGDSIAAEAALLVAVTGSHP